MNITSQPSGATVIVDGMDRGTTPVTLFDLAPGRHHLKYRLAGYAERDRFFHTSEGPFIEKNEVLVEEKGLRASVVTSGITGLSRIELNFPKGELQEEKPSWRPEHPLIPPAPSILQSAEDSAKQILNQLNKMDFCEAYSNLLSIARSANASLENFNAVLTAEQGGISEIVQNVRDASNSLRDFADQIRSNPSSILRSYTPGELPETKR